MSNGDLGASDDELEAGELGPVSYIGVKSDLLGRIVLVVHGAIDLTEAGELRAHLVEASHTDCPGVVVDLTDVHFMSSSGFGIIAQAHQELDGAGRSLHIRGASPTIRRAFGITQLDRILVLEEPAS